MPTHHATLGPSSSARWLQCPASIGMSEKVPRQGSSPFALEGTIAHELGEIRAGLHFDLLTEEEFREKISAWNRLFEETYGDDEPRRLEMERHIAGYVKLIEERMSIRAGSALLLEQRVETGVPGSWGTSDAVIFSDNHVEIIDLKYGAGVPVSAVWNSQLMLYGVGALDTFGDILGETETVYTTVFQPRLDNTSTFEISASDLRGWRDWHVKPLAREALESENPRFGPSPEACRWCPAAGICKPRMEANTTDDFMDPQDANVIPPKKLAEILRRSPEFIAWIRAVEDTAVTRAYHNGEEIPGFKVVRGRSLRTIESSSQAAAVQTLIDEGYSAEEVANVKTKALGQLEKLLGGRKELDRILGEFIVKPEGKPSVVPETDKREPISPEGSAAKDFA